MMVHLYHILGRRPLLVLLRLSASFVRRVWLADLLYRSENCMLLLTGKYLRYDYLHNIDFIN